MAYTLRHGRGRIPQQQEDTVPGEYHIQPSEAHDATLDSTLTSLPSPNASIRLASDAGPGLSVPGSPAPSSRPSESQQPAASEAEVPQPGAEGSLVSTSEYTSSMNRPVTTTSMSETSDPASKVVDVQAQQPSHFKVHAMRARANSSPSTFEYPQGSAVATQARALDTPALTKLDQAYGQPRLSAAQLNTVEPAKSKMTPDERERVLRRMTALQTSERPPSRGEGPSTLAKGKMVDPLNWGGVDIDTDELDVEAQRRELEVYELYKNSIAAQQERGRVQKHDTTVLEDMIDGLGVHSPVPAPAHVRIHPEIEKLNYKFDVLQAQMSELLTTGNGQYHPPEQARNIDQNGLLFRPRIVWGKVRNLGKSSK